MKKILKQVVLFLILSLSAFAAKEDYFVSAQWLKENLNNENLLILDSRGSKPSYMAGHIPGAVLTSWPEFSKMDGKTDTSADWGVLKERSDLESALQSVGLNKNSEVIIYTDPVKGFGEDARLLWMLNYVGMTNVKILEGGIGAWKTSGGRTASFGRKVSKGNFTISDYNKDIVISTDNLADKLEEVAILDSREPAEYTGEKNYGEARLGRIPGAKNIFFLNFMDSDGMLRSREEVDKLVADSGLDTNKTIVTYCTGGIRSAMAWLALTAYDYKVANYDSSFAGWTFNKNLPVER